MSLLEMTGVAKSVRLPDGETLHILRAVDVTLEVGDHVSIVGRSGTGKSTLLNILGLLDRASAGQYLVDGQDVASWSNRKRDRRRGAEVGFVFQQFNLLPGRTALQNVAAPLLYDRGRSFWRRESIAATMLARVGLADKRHALPAVLSGGEQQRVAIARALVRKPRVILADEPTGALDVDTGSAVIGLLDQIATETGAALVVITHDAAIANCARRHYQLYDGRLHPRILPPAVQP